MNRNKIRVIILTTVAIVVIVLAYYAYQSNKKYYSSKDFNIRIALDVESPLIDTDEILSESDMIDITVLGKETISIRKYR